MSLIDFEARVFEASSREWGFVLDALALLAEDTPDMCEYEDVVALGDYFRSVINSSVVGGVSSGVE